MFGEVADTYDRVRPSYPRELFEDVLAYAHLREGEETSVLECGAGTGKATVVAGPMLAASGWSLTCVEPDPAMAALLGANLERIDGLRAEIVTTGLEELVDSTCDSREGRYGLLYAAQSWHWVSPERRVADAARLLSDGGTLALIWNLPRPHPPALRADLDKAYEAVSGHLQRQAAGAAGDGARTPPAVPPSSSQPRAVGTLASNQSAYRGEIESSGLFGAVSTRSRHSVSRYQTGEWLAVLRTHSDHRLLPPDVLDDLLQQIGGIIDAHGGLVEVVYDAVAVLAKRWPRTRDKERR